MNRIGILCASDTELAPFFNHIDALQSTEKAMLKFYTGTISGKSIVAVYSGVCKVNAAIAAQLLIDFFDVNQIINAGVAGGIDDHIDLFDTVISNHMIYHDVAEDILTDFHPWLKENYFQADQKLYEIAQFYAKNADIPILFGTMVTGEQFIEDEKRAEINQIYAPLCVDMETASIAHVCYVNSVPFISVRTITDTAAHKGIAQFEQNCALASIRAAEIVVDLLRLM